MRQTPHPAVFLDRDGVLNRVALRDGLPVGPLTLSEFELYEGVEEAVRRLKAAGLKVVVVTNQPEVGRGRLAPAVLDAMHEILRKRLPLDAIYVCPHEDRDGCACRKPKPGMLTMAAAAIGIDLSRSIMVGDRWRDIEAGRAVGCRTYLVDRGYSEKLAASPDHVVVGLAEAVDDIVRRCAKPSGALGSPIGTVVATRESDTAIHRSVERPPPRSR